MVIKVKKHIALLIALSTSTSAHANNALYSANDNPIRAEEVYASEIYSTKNYYQSPKKAKVKQTATVRTICSNCYDFSKNLTTFPPKSPNGLLLSYIGHLEAPRGYNDFYRGVNPKPPKNLTGMTVGQVWNWQLNARRKANYRPGAPISTAAGRYQLVGPTFRRLVRKMNIPMNAKFDPALQDRMGLFLAEEAGWTDFRNGRISSVRFGNNLAGVWAALPRLSGAKYNKSQYHNFNGNRALTTAPKFLAFLNNLPKQNDSKTNAIMVKSQK